MQSQFTIQNLKCGGCANTITKGVDSVEGVSKIQLFHLIMKMTKTYKLFMIN